MQELEDPMSELARSTQVDAAPVDVDQRFVALPDEMTRATVTVEIEGDEDKTAAKLERDLRISIALAETR
jgi:hypothetical protein